MYICNIHTQYNLVEFSYIVTENNGKEVSVLDMLVDLPLEEFDENILEEIFFIITSHTSYTFSNFEINEFYDEGDFIRIICVKWMRKRRAKARLFSL